jgi:hypothetical protein
MFLRATTRKKDGKLHRYFSVVENKRVRGGRVVQRHVLYLGRSTPRRSSPGANPSKCWTPVVKALARWRFFPRITARRRCLMSRSCACGFRIYGSSARDNGADAGWRCSCGASWNSMSSGSSGCRRVARAAEAFGSGADHTQRAGEVLRRADDRCACAHHRRTRVDPHPLHPARVRAEAASGETADRFAAAVPAKNHRRPGRFRYPRVVQTLGGHPSMNQALSLPLPLESAKSG